MALISPVRRSELGKPGICKKADTKLKIHDKVVQKISKVQQRRYLEEKMGDIPCKLL